MLKGGSHKVPVMYRSGDGWVKLGYDEEHLIYKSSTMIRAGKCEYELEQTVEYKDRELYFETRDRFLEAHIPMRKEYEVLPLQRIPGDDYIRRGRYLELETQASGAFGWITRGVDTMTGGLVAIKELRITKRKQPEVVTEVWVGERFKVCISKASSMMLLTCFRMSAAYFRSSAQCVNTAIQRFAVIWRDISFSCPAQSRIS